MAAATILTKVYEFVHSPNMEVVQLTVSNAETYKSVKFKTILAAVVTNNEDNDGYVNVIFSGQTATIYSTASADTNMTLILFGRK
ncbi:MAG: hypothetical protein CMH64_01730 [Nanoarchaeota archaeon]|jgi:hypothetical protein|nr:hypothetical protein [Nanoarchaeota archaeon]